MTTTTAKSDSSLLDQPVGLALNWNWEKTLYLLLIIAAFVTRFYHLGDRVMSHDESLHTQWSWYLFQGRGFQHSPLMHGPLKFEVTAFVYWLLGDNDFTSRLPTALMGVAAVGLMYLFRKWLGRAGALVAALLMLISPYMLYYSRYIRDEPYVIVWGLLLAYCVIRYMESREAKFLYGLTAVSALFYATMETSFIYIAIIMLFLGLHVVRELFAVQWPRPQYRRPFEIAFALTLLGIAVGVILFFYGRPGGPVSGTETAVPLNPLDPTEALAAGGAASPYLVIAAIAGIVAALALIAGTFFVFRAFGNEMRRFPVLDLLVVFGAFVLPQLTAFPVRALGKDPIDYNYPADGGLAAFLQSNAGATLLVCLALVAVTLLIGWLWDWKKFLICAGIFYGLYIPVYTTFFTKGAGLATGLIGSLGYWLVQHDVRRGNQPWYYYFVINLPLYEFLPTLGALLAGALGLRKWLKGSRPPEPISPSDTLGFPVIGFFGFWAVLALPAFSIAGEKMPWLTTHITLPLILLAAWAIGHVIDGTDWQTFRERRAWIIALVLPVTLVALFKLTGSLLGGDPPFQGADLTHLTATSGFMAALLFAAMGAAAIYYLGRDLGWTNVVRLAGLSFFGLLALITARAAFVAAYLNYDSANEFLVYAHSARGVKTVMAQVDDLNARLNDGVGLKVAYDTYVAWPMTWYLREYDKNNYAFYGAQPTRDKLDAPVVIAGPEDFAKVESILGDRYYKFEYIRMVWPMQDYFNLASQRVDPQEPFADTYPCTGLLSGLRLLKSYDFSRVCSGLTDPQMREALWNIWWNRDYTLYGQLTNQSFSLAQWPVSERMRFYVRKDVAAQVWNYGVGPSTAEVQPLPEDPYVKAHQDLTALLVWGGSGTGQGQFNNPRAIAVAPDGSVYVADSKNNRIQKFDAQGNFLLAFGGFGSLETDDAAAGRFNEPWGVGVGPDGSVYVADTWNHRIQKFDANGEFLQVWGRYGQGPEFDMFWGPRAVVVDAQNRVYVSDTGNKRIAVFDADGTGLASIGSEGSGPGELLEPVGFAFGDAGQLYIADTWNQRMQLFTSGSSGTYSYASEWPIVGWYGQSLNNKPFVATDHRGRVYVTDPEGYRVLVFDADGVFLTTWGNYGTDNTGFALAAGITLDPEGNIYVSDSVNNRILKFPPLP